MECNPELERAEAELQERFRRERQENQCGMTLSRKLTNILIIWAVCIGSNALLCINALHADPGSDAMLALGMAGFLVSSFALALVMTALVALF
jgi:hypothetical protein